MASKWGDIKEIAQNDLHSLIESEKSYGDSWKRRGGTDGLLDDIGDLRRYLLLVEHEIRYDDPDTDTTNNTRE